MFKIPINNIWSYLTDVITSFASGVIFYTVIPLPAKWTNNWSRIARWCPLVGLVIGLILFLFVSTIKMRIPDLTCNALTVAVWVWVTGGLHLDGAMDTADGLSVTSPERRLEVMKDSATGAFGAIAAIIILLLKTVTLSEMSLPLWLVLLSATGWARWGQVCAIAFYPYLRATGKGSFHQENLRLPQDILLGLVVLLCFSGLWLTVDYLSWWQIGLIVGGNIAIALLTGYWFYRQLGGHTGDTYGAVVEWSEVLILCLLTAF
ncbi:adenosylcobinamide-GDP ribazoletransferase [Pleurocapsa sp. CCALA 161]|uniref:adenosylcobinamide-GDP ribazoletransferase n=1 Tax=Pleurocapsa sp. CCALA 161 TaxID=2107688 RepID=UPI000D07679A|nr:adenosylcobinamide-GDP ribazoletransferase [Pleurocapsa sp. CCALA 161]PSB12092.1 adenosylcobinamide-GDP ribazoletransferase [Pleurocapsa sp. CCALA 161]